MTAVVLTAEEREAVSTLHAATPREMLEALSLLPSYQRHVVRWFARAVRACGKPSPAPAQP